MPIYINKNGQQSGPYEDHVIVDQLRSAYLAPEDLAIRQGDSSWSRLGDLFPGIVPWTVAESAGYGGSAGVAVAGTAAAATVKPEPQYRKTALPTVFFGLCFLGVLGIFAACAYYLFTFAPTGNLEADLGRMGFRDLARNLAIGSFIGAFFTFLALLLSFKRKLIRSNGVRLALRVFFIIVLVVGVGNVIAGAITYLNYSAPVPTVSSKSNELLRALEAGSAATGPYEMAMFTVPIGAGLFLFGLSGFLMTKRARD
jgi:hypothetical protein